MQSITQVPHVQADVLSGGCGRAGAGRKSLGKSAVAGCYVTTGKLQRNCKVRVRRGKEIVFAGDLDSLRRNKDDVKDVATGFECGIGCDRFANWKDGDIVEGYKLVTQRRKLAT